MVYYYLNFVCFLTALLDKIREREREREWIALRIIIMIRIRKWIQRIRIGAKRVRLRVAREMISRELHSPRENIKIKKLSVGL